MQKVYDELYCQSKNGNYFYKLIEIIGSEQNIRLAYRNIKSNKGSKTPGTDGLTIEDIKNINDETLVKEVRMRLDNYKPQAVRRVYIPKEGSDKKRPLGIPTIWDRIVQQCILQVLDPICEPKFHNHSYGFRHNRSAHHALSRVVSLVNMYKHYYCVDIDVKGFFDNVNHGKLLKQIWAIGIRDKRLISIISKLLKAEIEGEGIPNKGTPQGGIISPLLSQIVLNELDWWVSNQWETFRTSKGAKSGYGFYQYARKYTNLKDGFIVRYADDFKIMCRTYEEAQRYYHAVVDFLKTRLCLDISPEKSKVINLKKNSSNSLGFKIKVVPKGKTRYGYIAKTDISKKAMKRVKINLKNKIKDIQNNTIAQRVINYNLAVIGIQNYYKYATNIYNNLTDINYSLLRTTKGRLSNKAVMIKFKETTINFQRLAKGIRKDSKVLKVMDVAMIPITGVHHRSPMNFSQDICNYTAKGREKIHRNLKVIPQEGLNYINNSRSPNDSIEFNDNKISKYLSQYGKCHILGIPIKGNKVYCHRKIPLELGGNDKYHNLIIVDIDVYKLIIETNENAINKLLQSLNLNIKQLKKLNNLRVLAGNQEIIYKIT